MNKTIDTQLKQSILVELRPTIIPFLPRLALSFLWMVIPFFFIFLFLSFGWFGGVIFLLIWFPGAFFGLKTWLFWKRLSYSLLDHSIIFFPENKSILFQDIYHVSFSLKGWLAYLFCYGTVHVFVKGDPKPRNLLFLRHPSRIQSLLKDICE
ncbi:hypothetical protein CO172_02485 [Candidatus Uhrbacteria bacterium CG_4_9_14_3_um_filter_36_7]|uniref:DUF304 domain-containing protein n=1 Tax=Candidatus Uhrbacteria bacterium CG_4_9_14_3_um_filter_36_7 TaxID=1975033 RepID=A0A2M7XHP4_9BACT|nr:MAG: hypothetical protein CO172_02485 [Candidatus Uhrbacteria bacterium CG_4_9_14_3_um_filter_36_7]